MEPTGGGQHSLVSIHSVRYNKVGGLDMSRLCVGFLMHMHWHEYCGIGTRRVLGDRGHGQATQPPINLEKCTVKVLRIGT